MPLIDLCNYLNLIREFLVGVELNKKPHVSVRLFVENPLCFQKD